MIAAVPAALLSRFGTRLRVGEPLATHTSFRIGGAAEFLLSARDREDIVDAIALADSLGIPWLVLGRGSNVLVEDQGVPGLIIRNDTGEIHIDRESGRVRCDSGVRLPTIGAQTAKLGLAGFEWAVGIPGSVGGAVVMNAGAHGGCVAEALVSAEILRTGGRETWPRPAFEYSYRTSSLQHRREAIVLGAEFQLRAEPSTECLARIQSYRQHRHDTQPTDPGAGSIFRNPPGDSAGRLIDQAGLKGTRLGGAAISPKHGNFIVNLGGATSENVLALIEMARETVFHRFGVVLQPEVEVIGPVGRRRWDSFDAASTRLQP